ncbi:UNVERIFIED_CONTAM: hypothetical protein H355_014076 [Colinus virginianus]|nr:hypothetical protein H355_014076 [Colinus virginianus]
MVPANNYCEGDSDTDGFDLSLVTEYHDKVLEESKCLMRSFLKSGLEDVNEKECQMLKQLWSSSKGLDSLFSYLQDKIYEV